MPHSVCQRFSLGRFRHLLLLLAALFGAPESLQAQGATKVAQSAPVVPGFERFFAKGESNGVSGGHLLLGELNCIACHVPDAAREAALVRRAAPVLDGIGSRVKAGYLRKFLSDPHSVKPGTTMPDVFAGVTAEEKAARSSRRSLRRS